MNLIDPWGREGILDLFRREEAETSRIYGIPNKELWEMGFHKPNKYDASIFKALRDQARFYKGIRDGMHGAVPSTIVGVTMLLLVPELTIPMLLWGAYQTYGIIKNPPKTPYEKGRLIGALFTGAALSAPFGATVAGDAAWSRSACLVDFFGPLAKKASPYILSAYLRYAPMRPKRVRPLIRMEAQLENPFHLPGLTQSLITNLGGEGEKIGVLVLGSSKGPRVILGGRGKNYSKSHNSLFASDRSKYTQRWGFVQDDAGKVGIIWNSGVSNNRNPLVSDLPQIYSALKLLNLIGKDTEVLTHKGGVYRITKTGWYKKVPKSKGPKR